MTAPLNTPFAPAAPQAAPAAQPTVLILGARGRLGLAAARAFAQAGWQVLAQVRPAAGGHALPAMGGVWWMPVAVHDTAELLRQARGAQVVVHAISPAYTDKAWRQEALGLLDAAIDVTQQLGATLMLPGNVYNFGEGMPAVLREDTPQAAAGGKGLVRVAMEQRLAAATQGGRMRAVVVRAGDFFGSGASGWLDQSIAKDLHRGRVTWPGPLDVATPWAYLPDLAATLVRVAEERHRLAAFDCLHFQGYTVSAQPWLHSLSTLAAERGWLPDTGTLRVKRLNWTLLRVGGLFMPMLASLAAMRYLRHEPHRLDNTRLRALIGEEHHTPFEQAARQALNDLALGAAPAPRAALA